MALRVHLTFCALVVGTLACCGFPSGVEYVLRVDLT